MQHIAISPNGIMLTSLRPSIKQSANLANVTSLRGKVSGWSGKSRSRFRRMLFSFSGDGSAYGVTCTLPCDLSREDWLSLFERFRTRLARLSVCGFWRLELQQNGRPHLHCVLWLCDIRLGWDVVNAWLGALSEICVEHPDYGYLSADFWPGAVLYSCVVQRARNFSLWRYLCDHASKKKQCQIACIGRNWGVINRKLLHESQIVSFEVSDRVFDMFLRSLRKLTHCKVSRGRGGRSVWFSDPETIRKMLRFYEETQDVPF